MLTGDIKSGFELGFNTGLDEVGVVGITVGTVVIGVVMSFWSVEISTLLVSPNQNEVRTNIEELVP